MRFRVTGADGTTLAVDAVDWMMAMCHVINHLDIEVSGWMCDTRPGGEVHVADPVHGHSWVVIPENRLGSPKPAPAKPRTVRPPDAPVPRAQPAELAPAPRPIAPEAAPAASEVAPAAPDPAPVGPPEDLAEQLFERSMDVSGASSPNEACRRALQVVLDLVPCEAGSVVRGGINDSQLTFVAASGPAAQDMVGRKLSYGEGLVGVAFDLGITVQVNDVSLDPRHRSDFDAATGFHTRSVLCVPVRTDKSFFGAIEILNPPGPFQPWHVEVVESVAQTLATTLSAAL